MANNILPFKEQSIAEIYNGYQVTYEVPIYQRNYAWKMMRLQHLFRMYDAYLQNRNVSKKHLFYRNISFLSQRRPSL